MKLCAIYNCWDGIELLPGSIKCLYDHVDEIIIVYQEVSNFGEKYSPHTEMLETLSDRFQKITFMKYDPIVDMGGAMNERAKRNFGLEFAKRLGCTHFLALDVDEYYEDFAQAKQLYLDLGHKGSVCRLHTYFKKPTFRFDRPEDYYVPFIHELKPDTKHGSSSYKFWVDPTRTVNESDIVELPIFMHHFSWVRHNILRKGRNSSANIQIQKGKILDDYNSEELGEGYFLTNWNRNIIVVPDSFGLSKIFQ